MIVNIADFMIVNKISVLFLFVVLEDKLITGTTVIRQNSCQ